MTSTRLPGKVLMDLGGKPMLAQQLARLKHCRRADEIVVATTTNSADDPLVELVSALKYRVFRGSEPDVLARYMGAARMSEADIIVRVTADCPLIDAGVVDRVIDAVSSRVGECDYASNTIIRTYPRGLDVEAFTRETLETTDKLATKPLDREHVTSLIRTSPPAQFVCHSVVDSEDNSDLRWTVDTRKDLDLVGEIYRRLDLGSAYKPYPAILHLVRSNPELATANLSEQTWDPLDSDGSKGA
jgi:spore coat polysaccharide biosynthesis protein SpsF